MISHVILNFLFVSSYFSLAVQCTVVVEVLDRVFIYLHFFFFFGHTCGMQKFPGQGPELQPLAVTRATTGTMPDP